MHFDSAYAAMDCQTIVFVTRVPISIRSSSASDVICIPPSAAHHVQYCTVHVHTLSKIVTNQFFFLF